MRRSRISSGLRVRTDHGTDPPEHGPGPGLYGNDGALMSPGERPGITCVRGCRRAVSVSPRIAGISRCTVTPAIRGLWALAPARRGQGPTGPAARPAAAASAGHTGRTPHSGRSAARAATGPGPRRHSEPHPLRHTTKAPKFGTPTERKRCSIIAVAAADGGANSGLGAGARGSWGMWESGSGHRPGVQARSGQRCGLAGDQMRDSLLFGQNWPRSWPQAGGTRLVSV